jgi:uncharacterized protein YkwD
LIAVLAQFVAAVLIFVGAQAGIAAGEKGAGASRADCPGQSNGSAPAAAQERAMLCLVNRARRARGLEPLIALNSLTRAADRKSGDVLGCNEFSHEACGREFTYWMTHFGYHGCSEGENIAWGSGSLGTPHSIFQAWMHSQGPAKTSSAATKTPGSASALARSKATAAPTSGPRSSAAVTADPRTASNSPSAGWRI